MHRTFLPVVLLAAVAGVVRGQAPATQESAPTTMPHRPAIPGISHIGFYSHDLAKSRAFYKGYLGFDEPYLLNNPDGTLHLTWMKINDHQTFEIFTEKAEETPRFYHIALETADSPALRNYLAFFHAKVPPMVQHVKIGNLNFMTPDPAGTLVEIAQYTEGGWTVKDNGLHMPATRISERLRSFTIRMSAEEFAKALPYYTDVLQFKDMPLAAGGGGGGGGGADDAVRVHVPEGADYIMFITQEAGKAKQVEMNLEVADVAKALETLGTRALPEGCAAPTKIETAADGSMSSTVVDPDHLLIHLVQPPR